MISLPIAERKYAHYYNELKVWYVGAAILQIIASSLATLCVLWRFNLSKCIQQRTAKEYSSAPPEENEWSFPLFYVIHLIEHVMLEEGRSTKSLFFNKFLSVGSLIYFDCKKCL